MNIIISIVVITMLFCTEEETYTFINQMNAGHILKYKVDQLINIELGGAGELQQGSNYILTKRFLGEKGGFHLIESTMTKMISTNVFLDRAATDFNNTELNNIPCILYIDKDGKIDHIESEYPHLEEAFKMHYLAMGHSTELYPFGKDAINISKGQTWTMKLDSLSVFLGDGSLESIMSYDAIFTLKKVKIKKGRKIAYINEEAQVKCDLQMIVGNEYMEGIQTGVFETSYIYDIEAGEIILHKMSADMYGEYEMNDMTFTSPLNISNIMKRQK